MGRMIDNVASLKSHIETVNLVIFLIATSDDLRDQVEQMFVSQATLTGITVEIRTRSRRFNKFWYLRNIIPFIEHYDKFMLLDSDISMVGFPVHDFFELTNDGVVGGALRKSVKDGLLTNSKVEARQHFAMFSAPDWIQYMDAEVLELPFIEMFFAVFDAKCARWFFLQILTDEYFHGAVWTNFYQTEALESDFGPDLMWCGAAAEWTKLTLSSKRPCLLALVTLEHIDDRQIVSQSVDTGNRRKKAQLSAQEQAPLIAYRREFSKWFDYSQHFRDKIGGQKEFNAAFISYQHRFKIKTSRVCVPHTD